MEPLSWYRVRTVFEHVHRARGRERLYEERVVLVRAGSHDEAIVKAEAEANSYATDGVTFLGYVMSFEMFDTPGEGAEVFSLIRQSRLQPKRYVDEFFDTGRERAASR